MEARDLILTGKPFTAHKYKEKSRPAITANWLPTRVVIPSTTHEPAQPNITSTRARVKDRSSMKSRTRPQSASVPGRKSFATTRPATGLSAPVEHTTLLSARDSKHSARIDLRTAQTIDTSSLFTTASEPCLMPNGKSINKIERISSEVHKCNSKVNGKDISDDNMYKGNSCHGDDKQTKSAIIIQRWYRRIKANRLESSQKLVQELLQQKKDDLNKSRIAKLEKIEAQAREMSQTEIDQQNRRAIKAQKARQAAIESLRLKREERKQEVKRIAEQEILMLQSSGKVTRKKVKPVNKPSNQRPASHHTNTAATANHQTSGSDNVANTPGDSPASLPAEVEQIFEANFRPHRLHRHPAPPTKAEQTTTPTNNNSITKGVNAPQGKASIYDDLLDTLKLLEEDPEPLRQSEQGYLSAANLHKLDRSSVVSANGIAGNTSNDSMANKVNPVGLNETKMQNILSFLDEMEKVDNETTSQLSLSEDQHQTRDLLSSSLTGQRTAEKTAEAVAADVTTTIMAQRMELDDKNKSILMLQKALAQQREMTVYHAKEHEKESERRLGLQKQEYESTIKRHLSFIDQLIDDKKVLSEKCEKLVKEVKELDKKCSQKVKALEEKHTLEITKQKEVAMATEKLRRERWVAEQSKKIKEITVKGLEPEIQRLIAKHKAEVQKIKVLHEAELLQADERASRRFLQQTEELRAQLSAEKEAACSHERELAKQRYEKIAEQEEMANQQQRKRLYQEVQLEKERLTSTFQQKQREMEQHFASIEGASNNAVTELRAEHEKVLGEMQRRHAAELKDLREKLQIEKEAWEENFMKKQDAVLMARQRELQDQLRRQRDKEIEMVIGRLEEESTAAREESDRNAKARIKRIREKYETELKEVEQSERSTLEKFNTMKEELVIAQGEATRLRSLLRQKESEVMQINEVVTKLNRERDNISDIVRQEFADRLVYTEEENKSMKTELSELRARHKVDLERVQKEKEKEMEQVHDRIKQAVAKKDEAMKSLRTQHEAALKRADHLEMLLERQRQELLKK